MKRSTLCFLFAGLALMLLVAIACAPAPAPAPVAPTAQQPASNAVQPAAGAFALNADIKAHVEQGKKLKFRLSYVDPSFEFAQQINQGIQEAAKELGVDALMIGPTPIDTAKQVADLEATVEQGVDGVGVTSIDDGIFVPIMNKYVDQGIPVVTFNVDSPTSKRLGYFGQDNYVAGKATAEQLIKYMGANPSGKVIVLSQDPSFSSLRDRAKGIQDALANYKDIQVIGPIGGTGSDLDKAYAAIENTYTQNPDVKAIVAVDGVMTPTLARFMTQQKLGDKVIGGGFDLEKDTLQGIKAGALKWSQGQFPYKQGYMAVKALWDAAHGKAVQSFDVGSEIVDSSNVDSYLKPADASKPAAGGSTFTLNADIKAHADQNKKLKFRLSYVDPSFEFAQQINTGIQDAAKELGVDALMIGPTPIDTAKQVADLEATVEQGVDGVGVTSIDDGIFVPIMNKYIDQGIPVVTFNVDSPSSKRLAYFGQDNYAAGKSTAEQLIKYMGANPAGKVIVLSQDPSFSSLRDRAKGIEDALKAYPNIQIIGPIGGTGSDLDKAYAAIENTYTQNPDAKAFLAVDGVMTPTLARFLTQQKLGDQVIGGGFDLEKDTLQAINTGALKWSQGQYPYKQGYMAVKALWDAAHGKAVQSFDVGSEIVDSTNVEKYVK